MVRQHLMTLEKAGFVLEAFGQDDFIVRAAPSFVQGDLAEFVQEMVYELDQGQSSNQFTAAVDLVAEKLACKAAIKFGQSLDPTKMRQLLIDLDNTPGATNCPHGRPVYTTFSDSALERIFKRH